MPLEDVIGPDDPFPGDRVGQPVTVSGTWVPDGTVFVSGREHDGQDGYWVVTPLAVGEPGRRRRSRSCSGGWPIPDDAPRRRPARPTVTAWLQPPEGTGDVDDDPTDDVLPQLRIADLIQHVDQDLYGAYGVVRAAPSRVWPRRRSRSCPTSARFTGVRNLLYAIEWWFFGGFAAFIWWRWVTETSARLRRRSGTTSPRGHSVGWAP